MGHDKAKYTTSLVYLTHAQKDRLLRIKEKDRHYSQTRIIEESLEVHLPVIEQRVGIKSPKAKPKEA